MVLEFRKQLVNFGALRLTQPSQRIVSGLKSLAPGAVGQHDLVVVAQEMHIFDLRRHPVFEPGPADQMLGRHQYLGLAKIQLRPLAGQQYPVIWRHQNVSVRQTMAKRATADQDRLQFLRQGAGAEGYFLAPDPANFLRAVVAGEYPIRSIVGLILLCPLAQCEQLVIYLNFPQMF